MAAIDSPPMLAQVKSSFGIWYIPDAYNLSGQVVQMRYYDGERCFQTPRRTKNEVAYWHRFVHPAMPIEMPKSYQRVRKRAESYWVKGRADAGHDNEFALQWGTHGDVSVEALPLISPDKELEPAYFTPVTCWSSGRTYYHAASSMCVLESYYEALAAKGLIRNTIPELLEEGVGQGHYVDDLPKLEHELAVWGYGLVLAQPNTTYYVSVEGGLSSEAEATFTRHFATLHVAQDEFDRLREPSPWAAVFDQTDLRVCLRSTTMIGTEFLRSEILGTSRYSQRL